MVKKKKSKVQRPSTTTYSIVNAEVSTPKIDIVNKVRFQNQETGELLSKEDMMLKLISEMHTTIMSS